MSLSRFTTALLLIGAAALTVSATQHKDGRSREHFCADYSTTCGYGAGTGKYLDEAACLASFDLAQYTLRQCFKYHLNVAGGSAGLAETHCPHTTGLGPCNLQKSFCWFYGEECTFDNTNVNRWDSAAVCEAGWASATGSQRECMHYHLLAAQESGNAVHCNHAAQQGGVCQATGATYCDSLGGARGLSVNHTATGCAFGAGTSQFANNAACVTKWDGANQKGTFASPIVTKAAGDVTQRDCLEYHLFAAWTTKDSATHCPHAGAAAPCEDARIGKTFPPTTGAATTAKPSGASALQTIVGLTAVVVASVAIVRV